MTKDGYVTDEAQLLCEIRDLLVEIRDAVAKPVMLNFSNDVTPEQMRAFERALEKRQPVWPGVEAR